MNYYEKKISGIRKFAEFLGTLTPTPRQRSCAGGPEPVGRPGRSPMVMRMRIMKQGVGYASACAPRWMGPVGGLPRPARPIDDQKEEEEEEVNGKEE